MRFRSHEKRTCHCVAVERVVPQTQDVAEMLVSEHEKEMKHNRMMLLLILKSIRFLRRQGLALRGDNNERNSNFIQSLKTVARDDDVSKWLHRKTKKYTTPEIQNEILKLMALSLLQKVAVNVQSGVYYTIMCDETTDSANKGQLVICLSWVDEFLDDHEDFIGLYEIPNTKAEVILSVIKDTLLRFNSGFSRCCGQYNDGVTNMSGCKSGVATSITAIDSRALFTHCYGHSLNLAVGDTIKGIKLLADVLDIVFEMCLVFSSFPQRVMLILTL